MRYPLTSLFLLPCIVMAQQLHTFKNGEVADAEEINQNFSMATQKLYSGDNYVGRIIPWGGDSTLVINQKGYFVRLGIWNLDYAQLEWSGSGTAQQKIFFTSDDCYGLGYIAARSLNPRPSIFKGARGHVYARQTQPEDPGDGFSPTPTETREALYVTYSQPLEPSVLPPNTYALTYQGACISEQPLADMILYEEKPNDPSVSGYNFGLEPPNPSIDIGL